MKTCDLYKLLKAGLTPYRVYWGDVEKEVVNVDVFVSGKWEREYQYDLNELDMLRKKLQEYECTDFVRVDNLDESWMVSYEND